MNEPEVIRAMLAPKDGKLPTIAVVGISDNPDKPSFYVSEYMQRQGYRVLPVNPSLDAVLGEKAYASLAALPVKPDVVNVFRLPRFVPGVVDEVIALGMAAVWVQQGIVHMEASAKAEAAGVKVVMDRCIMVEHRRMNAPTHAR